MKVIVFEDEAYNKLLQDFQKRVQTSVVDALRKANE